MYKGTYTITDKVTRILQGNPLVEEVAKQYCHTTNFLYLGRGFFYPVALERRR